MKTVSPIRVDPCRSVANNPDWFNRFVARVVKRNVAPFRGGALENLGTVKLHDSTAHYDAIHRSILAGLLGHVAGRLRTRSRRLGLTTLRALSASGSIVVGSSSRTQRIISSVQQRLTLVLLWSNLNNLLLVTILWVLLFMI